MYNMMYIYICIILYVYSRGFWILEQNCVGGASSRSFFKRKLFRHPSAT